jgi:hypothetical protein
MWTIVRSDTEAPNPGEPRSSTASIAALRPAVCGLPADRNDTCATLRRVQRFSVIASAALVLLLTACGSKDVSGTWSGTVGLPGQRAVAPMVLQLADRDGALSGEAFVIFMTVEVSGTRNGSEAAMTLTGGLLDRPAPLEGTFDKDRFSGRWWGPDATEPALVELRRQ